MGVFPTLAYQHPIEYVYLLVGSFDLSLPPLLFPINYKLAECREEKFFRGLSRVSWRATDVT